MAQAIAAMAGGIRRPQAALLRHSRRPGWPGPGEVAGGVLGAGVAGAEGAAPPLAEAGQGRVVAGHLGVEALDPPAPEAQALAEVRLLPGDQRRVEAAGLAEGRDPHQGVPAAGEGGADGGVPLQVAQEVVGGGAGLALAPAAADHGQAGVGEEGRPGGLQPVGDDLAVAVDELDEGRARHDGQQPVGPRVAGAGRGERGVAIQLDDLGAGAAGEVEAAVGRAGVHVDDPAGRARQGIQAGAEPVPLVPPDDDDAD